MYALVRPLLFALPPGVAHTIAMAGLAPLEYVVPLRWITRALLRLPSSGTRRVMGLDFPSPVGLAGGFDKNGVRARALAALGFGHIEIGTVTTLAQEANPQPNLFRLPRDRALINRLGFPNEGAARVVARLTARGGAQAMGVPLGISIGKSRVVAADDIEAVVADYQASFTEVRKVADFVVANVSSPNTKDLRAMQSASSSRVLFTALAHDNAEGRSVPLLVKIAPDLSDAALDALLSVVDETKLAGVVATNTTVARSGLVTDAAAVEAIGAGGLSGAPLRARALETVVKVRARLPDVVVVGVGGVECAEDAQALLDAGADLVQMYTGFVYGGPWAAWSIARGLRRER
jgi:dihydroorotate dehydrogenase